MRPCIHAYIHTYTNMYINVHCTSVVSILGFQWSPGRLLTEMQGLRSKRASRSTKNLFQRKLSLPCLRKKLRSPALSTRQDWLRENKSHTHWHEWTRKKTDQQHCMRKEHTGTYCEAVSKQEQVTCLNSTMPTRGEEDKDNLKREKTLEAHCQRDNLLLDESRNLLSGRRLTQGECSVSLGNSKNLLGKKRSAEPKPVESMSLAVDYHFQMWEKTRWDTANEKRERDTHTHTHCLCVLMTLWNRFFCVGPCFVEFCCHLQNCFCFVLACLSLNLFEFMSLKCIVEKRTRKLLCTYKCMHMALLQEGIAF